MVGSSSIELYLDNITSIELRIQYYSLIAATTTTTKTNFIKSLTREKLIDAYNDSHEVLIFLYFIYS
ncbi:MAG: hypothetical protein ACI8RD_006271 [Bacillariaceae sp.]